ncbi:MAG: hypothetical protein GTO14_20390 [Anaerolineales bacterium]|nr:hypothetical protein [Anaerolineales bacterium]
MKTPTLRMIEAVSVLLFFLQGLRVIFSVLFGIIYDQIFEGPMDAWLIVSNVLVVVVLILPGITPRRRNIRWLAIFAILAALSRVFLSVNDAEIRYWGSLSTLVFAGLYLAGLLRSEKRLFLQAMVWSLVGDQLLRVAGDTYDLSLRSAWLPAQIVWALMVVVLAIWLSKRSEKGDEASGGIGWIDGLALGGLLFLETSLLSMPNGVARWSYTPYALVAPILLGVTLAFALPGIRDLFFRVFQTPLANLGLAILLLLGLLVGYFTQGVLSFVALTLVQFTALAAFTSIFQPSDDRPRPAGGRVALGLFVFLLLNFLNAFAFTYAYTIPIMRAKGWLVYLVAGIFVGIAASMPRKRFEGSVSQGARLLPYGLFAAGAIVIAIIFSWPRKARPLPETGLIRIATYNIHYGYDDAWHFTLEEMAQAIEEAGVDVIAMQEVDTGRLTSYAVDDAHYLARRLRMNEAYLPTVESLTGIALLYRGPSVPAESRWVTSLQEQTGIVRTPIEFDSAQLNAFGIWMGLSNEDTDTQIKEALTFIGDSPNAVFGGDFNAEPDEAVVQAVLAAGFVDPFIELGIDPAPPTSPAIDPDSRIDYVFVRGLTPTRAWVSESLASDHRLVVVEVALPTP